MFFSIPRGSIFAKNGVTRGRFAGLFAGVVKKKFDFFAAVLQDVELKRGEKVKKNFGGLENVRIFAPAFERGRRPEGVPERKGRRE